MPEQCEKRERAVFKTCSACDMVWTRRAEMLADPYVQLVGYQVNLVEPGLGLLLFNHDLEECGTTFSIEAHDFRDLYQGEIYETKLFGTEECPEYCLHHGMLEACPRRCECAWVREVLTIIRNYPKQRFR